MTVWTKGLALLALAIATLVIWGPPPAQAQAVLTDDSRISAELHADGQPVAGREWLLALAFTPRSEEWHGYWSNPGDAGLGMSLDWKLPQGWEAGEPLYPVPQRLLIAGLMNHIYEGSYTVLVPVRIPSGARVEGPPEVSVTADYLACTDKICVPQRAQLELKAANSTGGERFDGWIAQVAPLLGSVARYEIAGDVLRLGLPVPREVGIGDAHVFLAQGRLRNGAAPEYAATQTFLREGNLIVAEIPLRPAPEGSNASGSETPSRLEGILSIGAGEGFRFAATPGDVPAAGMAPLDRQGELAIGWLVLAALAGGLLLNVMPCVFPILSLKALTLARAGESDLEARREALAYTAGVTLATTGLGAALLILRAAGEQVGWAFQLQQPEVVVFLFLLALAITANFLGLFEVPGFSTASGKPTGRGAFGTGLLAAFVATPCTGPFMAAALGAALLLPPLSALALFVALGIGLASPFLLIGFVPQIRARLPRPGAWMERFRRWMALPMGLTALALAWLLWRLGGETYLLAALGVAALVVTLLALAGRLQRTSKPAGHAMAAALVVMLVAAATLPQPSRSARADAESLLDPAPFSRAALAEARGRGVPVFVWFTADWCLTCKVNESVAIERDSTRKAFEEAGVVTLRGDWTRRDPAIARFLMEQGAAGVPLYLWYPPGGEAEQLPQVLTADLLAALPGRDPKRARADPR